jgi:ribosome biogenesis GTPase
MQLTALGWTPARAAQLPAGLLPARVAADHSVGFVVLAESGELQVALRGKLRADRPAVGDWVGIAESAIAALLPRTSAFARKEAGERTRAQVVAANIDYVLVCTAVGADFSPRRIERYVALAYESGAAPVVVITKADLAGAMESHVAEAQGAAPGVPVHAVSVRTGFDELRQYAGAGSTLAMLGSSGVGKSTIVNALLGADIQPTRDVREGDDKGRHTTTARQLFVLDAGGCVIDTPGMRELQLWDADLSQAFPDIEALATQCRFADCTHAHEPGCAVREGADPERLESYLKLAAELASLEQRKTAAGRADRKSLERAGAKALRSRLKEKGRR